MNFNQAIQYIQAFLNVLKNPRIDFSTEALEELTTLDQCLAKQENESAEILVETIKTWCKKHIPIRDAVLAQKNAISNNFKEIENPNPGNPVDQENILDNRFPAPIVREAIQERQNISKPKSEQHDSQKSPKTN
ncbi:MAG: hypothetical protein F6K36_22380 [Symploca sp. SIO3C6]|nr:hypothetical protein [Symploca sp. SIO3C6]